MRVRLILLLSLTVCVLSEVVTPTFKTEYHQHRFPEEPKAPVFNPPPRGIQIEKVPLPKGDAPVLNPPPPSRIKNENVPLPKGDNDTPPEPQPVLRRMKAQSFEWFIRDERPPTDEDKELFNKKLEGWPNFQAKMGSEVTFHPNKKLDQGEYIKLLTPLIGRARSEKEKQGMAWETNDVIKRAEKATHNGENLEAQPAPAEARAVSLQTLIDALAFMKSLVPYIRSFKPSKHSSTTTVKSVRDFNMHAVNQLLVVPYTQFTHYKPPLYTSFARKVGCNRPDYFISHSWFTSFSDFVEMAKTHFIRTHGKNHPMDSTFYWVCTFANFQHDMIYQEHNGKSVQLEIPDDPFTKSAHAASSVVSFQAWTGGLTLKRPWCFWELMASTQLGSPAQRKRIDFYFVLKPGVYASWKLVAEQAEEVIVPSIVNMEVYCEYVALFQAFDAESIDHEREDDKYIYNQMIKPEYKSAFDTTAAKVKDIVPTNAAKRCNRGSIKKKLHHGLRVLGSIGQA